MKTTSVWRTMRPADDIAVYSKPSLQSLPGGHPLDAPPDQMHTWHHGVGREFVSSAIAPSLQTFMIECHARMLILFHFLF